MGDEERFLDEPIEDASDSDAGPRTGFLPGVVITLLKYAAIALGIIAVAATTAVFTLRLINQGSLASDLTLISEEYNAKQDPLEYYDNIDLIRGVTSDEVPEIFSVRISIGYGFGEQQVSTELTARRREIQHLVFLHLSQKRSSELRPENYNQLAEDLKQKINQVMKQGRVQQVVFREFVVAP